MRRRRSVSLKGHDRKSSTPWWKDWKISDDVFHPLQKRHTTGALPQLFLREKRASAKVSFAGRKIIRSGEKVDGSRGNSVVV